MRSTMDSTRHATRVFDDPRFINRRSNLAVHSSIAYP
jgi:hypothetical protein